MASRLRNNKDIKGFQKKHMFINTNNDLNKHDTEDYRMSNMNTTDNLGEIMWSRMVSSSCSTSGAHRVTVTRHEQCVSWKSCWTQVSVHRVTVTRHEQCVSWKSYWKQVSVHRVTVTRYEQCVSWKSCWTQVTVTNTNSINKTKYIYLNWNTYGYHDY
jgi:hypothetical protein